MSPGTLPGIPIGRNEGLLWHLRIVVAHLARRGSSNPLTIPAQSHCLQPLPVTFYVNSHHIQGILLIPMLRLLSTLVSCLPATLIGVTSGDGNDIFVHLDATVLPTRKGSSDEAFSSVYPKVLAIHALE